MSTLFKKVFRSKIQKFLLWVDLKKKLKSLSRKGALFGNILRWMQKIMSVKLWKIIKCLAPN
ncbi:hypothetical protein BpHYR1_021409 [Brachionus plicatilis]|uniref:Uncharacterized protein n=1 Tax=Brachionus plicatilis TaxID=10195 RepID=A0A3M7PYN5_BRAPC|nr:hypothetical protein BpHYR1_021409 [Brachionus plicatilis]